MLKGMFAILASAAFVLGSALPGYTARFAPGARPAPRAQMAPGGVHRGIGHPPAFSAPGFRGHPPAFRSPERFRGHPGFRREDFHHHDGFHHGFGGPRVFIGPTFWWGPPGWYGPAYTAPPVIVQETPPVYVPEPPAAPPTYWYYCQNPQGYYPYVQECPGGWTPVTPQPTPAP